MKKLLRLVVAVVLLPLLSFGQQLPSADFFKGFSADIEQVVNHNGQELQSVGKIYVTPQKMRLDTSLKAQGMDMGGVVIIRIDKMISWMLMPQMKTYMEMPLQQADVARASILSKGSEGLRFIGKETIDGTPVGRYEVTSQNECKTYLFLQEASQLPVRSDSTCDSFRSVTRFRNVVLGEPSGSNFELPSGYTKFDASALMNAGLANHR